MVCTISNKQEAPIECRISEREFRKTTRKPKPNSSDILKEEKGASKNEE